MDIIGNIKGGAVGVAILTLDPDKTIKDLQDWHSGNQPPWSLRNAFYKFPSDGIAYSINLSVSNGPIYFLCFYEFTETPIGALGPVEVKK
jgi:hypothetical protein